MENQSQCQISTVLTAAAQPSVTATPTVATVTPTVAVTPTATVTPVGLNSNYSTYNSVKHTKAFHQLLDDNLELLIEYIYDNIDREPYNNPETRVGLSLKMLLTSRAMISHHLSNKIYQDIDNLKIDKAYLSRFADPGKKIKYLKRDQNLLKKHTEVDNVTLNYEGSTVQGFDKYPDEIDHAESTLTAMSTLNVSNDNNCSVM